MEIPSIIRIEGKKLNEISSALLVKILALYWESLVAENMKKVEDSMFFQKNS
jgi:hypothetical protein